MKAKLFRMLRSSVALLLVFCMVAGYIPATVFATGSEPAGSETESAETIYYVSLGDSMTNGYGLNGYQLNSGVETYGGASYANTFEAYLAEQEGVSDVDHAQLAMSGIRTEDIHWLLELDYNSQEAIDLIAKAIANRNNWSAVAEEWNNAFGCGDYWTVTEICNHSRLDATHDFIKAKLPEGYVKPTTYGDGSTRAQKVALVAKYYQEKVAAADVISLSVGNGNIGVFGLGRILEVIGFEKTETYKYYNYEDVLRECDEGMKEKLQGLIGEIKPTLVGMVSNEDLVNVVLYIAVSLAMNYAGTLDAILQMNPDVKIVLVPVMNTFAGDADTEVEGTTIGDLMGLVVDPINKFIAGLPTYMQVTNHAVYKDAKFYYAEPGLVQCMVDVYGEDFYFVDANENGKYDEGEASSKETENAVANPDSITRDRFVQSIVVDEDGKAGMVWGLMSGVELVDGVTLTPVSLAEVMAYDDMSDTQKAAYAAANTQKAVSIAVYLAFEDAILASKTAPVTLDSVMGLSGLGMETFAPVMADFMANANNCTAEQLAAAIAVVAAGSNGALTEQKVRILLGDEAAMKSYVWDEHGTSILGNSKIHDSIESVLACETENCPHGCQNARNLYAALKTDYAKYLFAAQVAGTLNSVLGDPARIETLYKGYLADEKVDAEAEEGAEPCVENWMNAVYEVAAEMLSGNFEDISVEHLKQMCATVSDTQAYQTAVCEAVAATTKYSADTLEMFYNNYNPDEDSTGDFTELYATLNTLMSSDTRTAIRTAVDGINAYKGQITGGVDSMFGVKGNVELLCMLLALPTNLSAALVNEANGVSGLLALFGRCIIGNGLGGHPSADGHAELARAVIAAYEEGYTAEDETDENFDIDPVAKKIVSDLTAQGYLTDDQIIDIAMVAYEDYKDGSVDLFAIVDEVYDIVLMNTALNDTQRLEIISIVYNDLKDAGYLAAYGSYLDTLEAIIALDVVKENVPSEYAFDIVEIIYGFYMDDQQLSDNELFELINDVYNTLFYSNSEMTADDRLAVISGVYNILKDAGYLAAYGSYLDTLEKIIAALDGKVSDDKAFALVGEIYGKYMDDGELTNNDVRHLIGYIWGITLSTDSIAVFALTDDSEEDESNKEVENKLAIMAAIFEVLAEDTAVQETFPQVAAVVELYKTLTTEDENGEKLVPDEVLIDLFDEVIDVIAATDGNGEFVVDITDPDEVTAKATDIVTNLVNDERISPENKFEIIKEVKETLQTVGGTDNGEDNTEEDENDLADEILALTEALHKELKEAGYLTDDQFNAIMKELTTVLTNIMVNGQELTEEQMKEVVENVYRIVFEREDLTIADKLQIVIIIYNVLDEFGYIDSAYAKGYAMAKDNGYVTEARNYIAIALNAVATAKNTVANFAVEEAYENIKTALLAEIDATIQTLNAIDDLLENDALATKADAWDEILGLRSELDNHIAKLQKLAKEIGVVIDSEITKAVEAAEKIADLVKTTADEAYAWIANGVKEFNAEYAALVEEIGLIVDDLCNEELGAAVRKYLTETPADALGILYAHGENAIEVLVATAALASADINDIYNALSLVVKMNGKDIYDKVAASDEVAEIFALIDDAKADLLNLYNEFNKGSIDTDYEQLIDDAQNVLMNLYDLLYIEIGKIATNVAGYPEIDILLDAAWTALMDLVDVADYAGEYGAWIAADIKLMLSEQVWALFANNDEFMQVAFPLFVENAKYVDEYLQELVKDLGDEAWNVYLQIRDVISDIVATIQEYGDQAWTQIQKQLDTLRDIVTDVAADIQAIIQKVMDVADAVQKNVTNTYNNLINELNSELDALITLIENELKTATGDAKESLQALLEAAKDLKAALAELVKGNIYEAITNIQSAHDKMVEALKDGVQYLSDAVYSQLLSMVDTIGENICELVKGFNEILKNALGDTYDKLVDLIVETVREQAAEGADWIYNWLYNNPDKVIAWISEYGDDVLAFVTEHADAIGAVIGYLVINYGEDIVEYVLDNADEILATMVEWFEKHGENAWELIKVYLAELGVIDAIGNVQDSLTAIIEQLKKYVPEIDDALIKLSQDVLNSIQEAAQKLIKLVEDEINNFINSVKPDIEASIKKLQSELDALKKELAELNAKLEAATGEAKKKIALAIVELEKKIAEIEAAIAELEAQLSEILAKLEALKEAALALNEAIEKAIAEGIDAVATEIQAALNDVLEAILDVIEVISDEAAAELNKIAQMLKGALNQAYVDATTAEYEINAESYYVAIGDDTAVSTSYVDVLTKELADMAATEDYVYESLNLAKTGMTMVDASNLLKTNAADIAKADLITLGFGNNGFTDATVANLTAAIMGNMPEFDWSTYVTEEGVPYVEKALADIRAELIEAGVEGELQNVDVVDMLMLAIESYAYGYVSYVFTLPEVIEGINEINEDALIVVVGMHNPMENVVLTLDDENSINLGDYLQYLVDAVNIYAVAYAMADGEVTYVAAPAVETGVESTEMGVVQFLMAYVNPNYRANLNPTEEGHEYIAEQILNALDITVADALWDVYGANMTLTSSLAMNFFFERDNESDWSGYYAKVVKSYADGRADVEQIIPVEDWKKQTSGGVELYRVTFNGIAAKEMSDDIQVTIYNAEDEAQSYVWTDSVRDYAMRGLSDIRDAYFGSEADTEKLEEEWTLMVDMLNYGAAAQQLFGYDTGDLANAELTRADLAFGTQSVETENRQVKGENFYGSNLTLENEIRLNFYFTGVTEDMTAKVTFTNHAGRKVEEAAQLDISGRYGIVRVDQIAVADGRTDVTVTVYNADGTVYGTITDSMESYIDRASEAEAENAKLYEKIMMFSDAAYAFLH